MAQTSAQNLNRDEYVPISPATAPTGRRSDKRETLFNGRYKLTGFLYPDDHHRDITLREAMLPPEPNLQLQLNETRENFDEFVVTSDTDNCNVCNKQMNLLFYFKTEGFSYIYDKSRQEMVHPNTYLDIVHLAHKSCLGEMRTDGINYIFQIVKEYLPILQWKMRDMAYDFFCLLVTFIYIPLTVIVAIYILVMLEKYIHIFIMIFMLLFMIVVMSIYMIKLKSLISDFKEYWEELREYNKKITLITWRASPSYRLIEV